MKWKKYCLEKNQDDNYPEKLWLPYFLNHQQEQDFLLNQQCADLDEV
jgi:hypothetical protein